MSKVALTSVSTFGRGSAGAKQPEARPDHKPSLRQPTLQAMTTNADIVIAVGAGAAGIAWRGLATSGFSAMISETTARIGGQAWTCEMAGMPSRSRLPDGCIPPIATMDPRRRSSRLRG